MTKRLPDDPAYWEHLAQRIENAAWSDREERSASVVGWLAQRGPLVAGSAIAAAALLLLALRAVGPGGAPDWTAAVVPNDALSRELGAARPPALGGLLTRGAP